MSDLRKTKIICTLGPAVDSEELLRQLILGGMNAARFNFSHGTHETHLSTLNQLRRVRDALGYPIATIMDTKGPEIRIKTFQNGPVILEPGAAFSLTTQDVPGDGSQVSVTYENLHEEVFPGCHILVDDGLVDLLVEEISGRDIRCTVENGGTLSNNKSINLPGVAIHLPSLTEKDREDLRFAAEQDFDYVAASFVRKAADVTDIRAVLDSYGGTGIRIISKIENREGADNLDEIIAVSDGLMVARGDLGVEIPVQQVPILQKQMISRCIREGKPVIIATQMLDSMIRNPRATRAEISDVANAVFDGASCVMLSGETASGKYPLEAVRTMVDTVTAAEQAINYWGRFRKLDMLKNQERTITDAISHSCCSTAMDLGARAILVATQSGHSARAVSRFRPACPVAAFTTTEKVRRQLAISWGVHPYLCGQVDSTDRLISLCVECAQKEGVVRLGDTVVIAAGVIGKQGTTNLLKAQKVEPLL